MTRLDTFLLEEERNKTGMELFLEQWNEIIKDCPVPPNILGGPAIIKTREGTFRFDELLGTATKER